MAKPGQTEKGEQERVALMVPSMLSEGRMPYAAVRAEYERRAGIAGAQAADTFHDLVQKLIAQKLIDYESEAGASDPLHGIAALWLRPWGRARLEEAGPSAPG